MAHIAINISEPYTFDKIMSASELMLYTNISNYLVDGVDMNTILSALAEFTDDAIFHPVKINQENNMFQEWNGVNYVDTVKATGQNIEVEIGDNKVINSMYSGPGVWQKDNEGTLVFVNVYPSVDKFYRNSDNEWQIDNENKYHDNVKYVFHSLQPHGIEDINIENGDFTDYSILSSNLTSPWVRIESKRETFAFGYNDINKTYIKAYSPSCGSDLLSTVSNTNSLMAQIDFNDGMDCFLWAATDDEWIDYDPNSNIDANDYKGGCMSFSSIINIDLSNLSFIVKNPEYPTISQTCTFNQLHIYGDFICLYSKQSSLDRDTHPGEYSTSIVCKSGLSKLLNVSSFTIDWGNGTSSQAEISIVGVIFNLPHNWDDRFPKTMTYEFAFNISINGSVVDSKIVGMDFGHIDIISYNINTFGRMREYAIPEPVTIEYAVHSIEGGGRNYNPEVMAWLNSTDWYNGNPNYMTFEEAAAVDSEQFSGTNNEQKKAIVTFDEARFFTSVTYLTPDAFYNCKLLKRITLPDTLTEIRGFTWNGYGTFGGCTSLVSINVPDGVTTIGSRAFYNCSSLAIDYLSNTITSIGGSAFHGCSSLNLLSLPSNLTTIEYSTFGECTSLALTSLPSGITSISNSAFNGCTALALTSLPNGLTTIGVQAFQSCLTLKDTLHEIPSSVTEIADRAFRYVKFPSLKFLGLTPPTFGVQSIYTLPQKVDCQVPSASLTEYQQAMEVLTGSALITISTY